MDKGSRRVGHGRPRNETCETNPICRGPMRATSACEEKGYGSLRRSLGHEKRSQTKPIGRTPSFHHSIVPAFQSDADCAKRTQSAGAVPRISSLVSRGDVCAKQTQSAGWAACSVPVSAYLVVRISAARRIRDSRYEIPDTRHEKITPYGVTTNGPAQNKANIAQVVIMRGGAGGWAGRAVTARGPTWGGVFACYFR